MIGLSWPNEIFSCCCQGCIGSEWLLPRYPHPAFPGPPAPVLPSSRPPAFPYSPLSFLFIHTDVDPGTTVRLCDKGFRTWIPESGKEGRGEKESIRGAVSGTRYQEGVTERRRQDEEIYDVRRGRWLLKTDYNLDSTYVKLNYTLISTEGAKSLWRRTP